MPYSIRKLPNKDLYKVSNKETGKVYGITKNPSQFIKAIETNKHK